MDNYPIRILRIVAVMNRGGIETQIMNMYRKLDKSKFQFDFLVTRDEPGVFDGEIEKLGGKIYRILSVRKVGLFKFIKNIDEFFKNHKEYKIVHCHMNTWSGLFLNIAKRHRVPIRIAQSHSAQQGIKNLSLKGYIENCFKKVMKLYIKKGANHFWAVGKEAGEWLYGEKIARTKMKVIPNAKDLEMYKYDSKVREELRRELGIPSNSILIGHVGSFSPVKNHEFLINLFEHLRKKRNNCTLCLVGDGPLRTNIEKKVSEMKIKENVLFSGLRNDVNKLMSAFDFLILPSLFEGMPNVVIEAQAASLPCILSDSITKEVDMGMGIVDFVSLNQTFDYWEKVIFKDKTSSRPRELDNIINKGYDLNRLILWLQEYYDNALREEY
jgi:glycosyltransferase involved in cell wall biosynthesis